MVTSALARPVPWRFMATASGDSPDRISAGHAAGPGAMPIVVLLLLGVVVVLGTLIRTMLATIATITGQAIRLFGIALLALVAAVILLAGAFSRPATGGNAPAPATSPAPTSTTAAPGAPVAGHPAPTKHPARPGSRLG